MGSKGRIPPPHLRRPLPGPAIAHPESYGPGIHHAQGAFPPFDMMPPPEVMEQKLAAQHVEMQRLVTENQRLAATHGTLRQELAGAQHELQILHVQIGAVKSEREQQMRSLMDKIAKMEADLQSAEPFKLELQQARAEAQSLLVARQELFSRHQQLSQDLQRVHSDVQQIPALISELESLRQEYQHCRATYDYEKKLYNDHLESLQVMDKNYVTMARELEKLQAELSNSANTDRRAGGPYGGTPAKNENEASGNPVGQNAYEDGYNIPQGRGPLPAASGGVVATAATAVGTPGYVGAQSGPAPARPGYDAPRGPGYDASGGPAYDAQRGPSYDALRGPGYDMQRVPNYDAQRGPTYDAQRGAIYDAQRAGYDAQRGPGYDASRGASYDAQSRGAAGPHGHAAPPNNAPYGSATPPARGASAYDAPPRSGNPVRR
ncbi:protein FLX-like 2 [Fagus crenata]